MKQISKTGQAAITSIVITSAVTTGIGFYVTKILSSPTDLSASVSDVKTDVAVLKKSDSTQDKDISDMKKNIEYIRRGIEGIANKQGITIKE